MRSASSLVHHQKGYFTPQGSTRVFVGPTPECGTVVQHRQNYWRYFLDKPRTAYDGLSESNKSFYALNNFSLNQISILSPDYAVKKIFFFYSRHIRIHYTSVS